MVAVACAIALAMMVATSRAAPAIVESAAPTTDGDTVIVDGYTVRLKGVDAPEQWMLGGPEATAAMREIVGSWLKCELTGEKTRGREVGFCRNAAGEDIGQAIIECGFALACPRYSKRYVQFEQPKARQGLRRARYCEER
jgi:endonuclease YncB( thermonuclease family)